MSVVSVNNYDPVNATENESETRQFDLGDYHCSVANIDASVAV